MDTDYTNINDLPVDSTLSQHTPHPNHGSSIHPSQLGNHPVPTRDMPRDTTRFSHDTQIQPNYVPDPGMSRGYVEDMDRRVTDMHRNPKPKEKMLDRILEELQLPLMLASLFFLFQSPWVTQFVLKWFGFLSVQAEDLSLNLNGKLLMSLLFGGVFYAVNQALDYLKTI
jgi:hypothetical protein